MNRKLITNERLLWPELSSSDDHEKILNCLETQLQNFPQIKRRKNPPKKERLKIKQQQQQLASEDNKIDETTQRLRKHFLFGINTVTRYLEKLETGTESKVLCLFVCKSCKPLAILTRHLLIMCAQRGIKAACIIGLSQRITKIFNMKRTSAFVILNESKDGLANEPFVNMFQAFESEILPLIPQLKNPLFEEKIIVEDISANKEMAASCEVVEMAPKRTVDDLLVFKEESEATGRKLTSADFFSFSDHSKEQILKKNSIAFDSENFIFSEDYGRIDEGEECETGEATSGYFPSKKRQKTEAPRYFGNDGQPRKTLKFMDFDIVNRVSKRAKNGKKNKNKDNTKKQKVK